jgi:polar amino acid transport system substrate-binding protein
MTKCLAKSVAIVLYLVCSVVFATELKLVASPWPPYVGPGLHKNGVAMHLVTEGLRRAGYESSVTLETWPRDLEDAKRGRYDVIAAVWYSEQRTEFLTFSEPYVINAAHFFKRRDTQHTFKTLADLAGLKIGVVEGYAYGESFYMASDFKRVSHGTVLENLRSLVAGNLDLILADTRVAFYELNVNIPSGIQKVSMLDIPYATKGLRIGVSKQHPDHEKIIGNFNAAIAAMKEDGSYAEILASHRVSATE